MKKLLLSLFFLISTSAFSMVGLVEQLAAGVVDSSGNPLSGGLVYFYEAGTTTPITAYQEYELTNALSNPATLDAAGKLTAFVSDRIKLVIKTAAGASVATIDDVNISDSDLSAAVSAIIAGDGLSVGEDGTLDIKVDNSTIEISSNTLRIKDSGVITAKIADSNVTTAKIADSNVTTAKIADSNVTTAKIADSNVTTAKIADSNVTQAKRVALGQQISNASGTYTHSTAAWATVDNLGVTITTTGRPLWIGLIGDNTSNSYVRAQIAPNLTASSTTRFLETGTSADFGLQVISNNDDVGSTQVTIPCSSFSTIIPDLAANTYTFAFQVYATSGAIVVEACHLAAFEL
jgi:hypothetical protein